MNTSFITSEAGAVTVDWVVLTGALVGLGLATMGVVSNGVENLSKDIDTELKSDSIIQTSFAKSFGAYTVSSNTIWNTTRDTITASVDPESTAVDTFWKEGIDTFKQATSDNDQKAAQEGLDVAAAAAAYLVDSESEKATEYSSTFDTYVADYNSTFGG